MAGERHYAKHKQKKDSYKWHWKSPASMEILQDMATLFYGVKVHATQMTQTLEQLRVSWGLASASLLQFTYARIQL